MKSQFEATEMWFFYGVCCVGLLHGLTKCQMKKYFKEPIHQEISWRLLLTDKSDLWDTSWERVSWKRSRWPGWPKAKELEVDKGKRLWTSCHSLVRNNGRSMTYQKPVKIVMNILYWSPTSESDTALTFDWLEIIITAQRCYAQWRSQEFDLEGIRFN